MFELPSFSIEIPQSVIEILFYLMISVFVLMSAIALYSLIRYGKNRAVVVAVTITYIAVSTVLFFIAQSQMKDIQF